MEHTNDLILNYFKEFEITEDQLKELQNILLSILQDIHNVCEDNNLSYMLCGGTLLGAIRHNGFIPWDDDVDIMMPRCDYEKLKDAVYERFDDKYYVTDIIEKNCPHKMMKIMLRGTIYKEILLENHPYISGIFIDVFPIDNVPKNYRQRARLFNFYSKSFFAIRDYKFPSQSIMRKCKESRKLKKYYYKRRRIGAMCNLIFGRNRCAKKIVDLARYDKVSSLQGIPLGIYYETEIFPVGTFDNRIVTKFCGKQFYIPQNYDIYLKNLYGNYMQLPSPDKRRRHQVAILDFGNYKEH